MDSFAICRSFGMQGVHVEERDKKLVVTEFYEPCLAQELGCLCVGDTIVSIDGEAVSSESDILVVEADTSVAEMEVKITPKPISETERDIKRFGERYLNIADGIKSLKSTHRKDHIDIAIATMQQGNILIENGDLEFGRNLVEDALNNAYGLNGGINDTVCACYCSQAQVAYLEDRTTDLRRHLLEAIEVYKKIGESMDIEQFKVFSKLVSVAQSDEESTFRDTIARQAMELQQKIVVNNVRNMLCNLVVLMGADD